MDSPELSDLVPGWGWRQRKRERLGGLSLIAGVLGTSVRTHITTGRAQGVAQKPT